jgi:small subunit ribosomal protein S3
MGQKVHPNGFRLGISKDYLAKWYAEGRDYADTLCHDIVAREYLEKKLEAAGISRIDIERPAKNAKITIHAARPGVIIGKSGREIDVLRGEVSKRIGVPVHINIEEVRRPDVDSRLVAESIAQQLVKRVSFRRAVKRALSNATRAGAKGIKVCVSGRLGGAEIARSEWSREGRVPLHTLRANIDYGVAEALTTYGIIGVKVWIYKGDLTDAQLQAMAKSKAAKSSSKKPATKAKPAAKPAAKAAVKTAVKKAVEKPSDKTGEQK